MNLPRRRPLDDASTPNGMSAGTLDARADDARAPSFGDDSYHPPSFAFRRRIVVRARAHV